MSHSINRTRHQKLCKHWNCSSQKYTTFFENFNSMSYGKEFQPFGPSIRRILVPNNT